MTVHKPTGEVLLHSVGVSLELGAALGQAVVLQYTEAEAAHQMRAWLERIGSPVHLVDLGRRCYALRVAGGRRYRVRCCTTAAMRSPGTSTTAAAPAATRAARFISAPVV